MSGRQLVEETVQPAPTGIMPGEQPAGDPLDEEAVAPGEQQFYDQFIAKAIEFIHGPKSSKAVMKHLNQKDLSVPEAVGRTTAMIAKNIIGSAQAANQEVSGDAVFSAGQEIVEELLEVGSRAKIFPLDWPTDDKAELSPEQQDIASQAFSLATHYFGQEFVQSEQGKGLKGEAENIVLRNVQKEAQAGTLDPRFMTDPNTVEGGVKRALIRPGG